MTTGELLLRIARTLKQDIGPAIEDEYPKTQAYMAAVVAEKLGRQLALAEQHEKANRGDIDALLSDLSEVYTVGTMPVAVSESVSALAATRDKPALAQLIEALYASQDELGEARFNHLLGRVRITLRAGIDRQMEYAA